MRSVILRPMINRLGLVLGMAGVLAAGMLAAAQEPAILRVGLLDSADSPAGRGAQMAIAEINGAGGLLGPDGRVYAFELLSVPVTTADEVRSGLQALAERDVLAILGPDDTAVTLAVFNELRALARPVLTAATGDSITIADTADFIFRSRAPEQVYTQAAATFLLERIRAQQIVIVQAGEGTAESVTTFMAALSSRNIVPRSTLQWNEPDNLDNLLANLRNLNPDTIAVWGQAEAAADLLVALRGAGWEGTYFYRDADRPAFQEIVRSALGPRLGSVVGVTNWAPGVRSAPSDRFLRRYVTTFGAVPDGLSAATYDAVYLLAAGIEVAGPAPEQVRQGLQRLESRVGVQGTFTPGRFVIGETINAVVLFELNAYAVPQVLSLYVNSLLVPNPGEEAVVLQTPVPPTPTVTPTITPTATPEGVYAIVQSARLNVRTGPGLTYDVIGQLQAGDVVFPVGANADFSWLVVPFRGSTGWVATYLVDLRGPRNLLPVIVPPPSPTPVITATPSPVPLADLIVLSASVEPVRPISGQQFLVRAVIRNQGVVTSVETALAASFQPGEVYTSAPIMPLAPGQSTEVFLTPTVSGSGTYTVQLVTDLNNLVNEGPAGEANNLYPVTYTLDRAVLRAGAAVLAPGQEHDMMGSGTSILRWDGVTLSALNGAQVAVLPGVTWGGLYYDLLLGVAGGGVPRASLPTGAVVGLITAPEGYRGALRIDGYDGDTIRYTFRVYTP